MSHLEEWRELENLSVSKQLFRGEEILRETNREFTEGGKYKWWFQGSHFTRIIIFPVNWLGTNIAIQVLSTKSAWRAPAPHHTPAKNQIFLTCAWTRHSDPLEPDVIFYKTKEVSLHTSVRYVCKSCYKKPFQMGWYPVMWQSSHIPTKDPSFTVTRSRTPVPSPHIHLLQDKRCLWVPLHIHWMCGEMQDWQCFLGCLFPVPAEHNTVSVTFSADDILPLNPVAWPRRKSSMSHILNKRILHINSVFS